MSQAVIMLLLLATSAFAGRSDEQIPDVSEIRVPDVADQPFVFGPGDKFSVQVFRHPELNAEIVVAPDGTATYPLVGRVQVAGRGYTDLVADLEAALREYYTDASVAVNVVEISNQKVFVVGEVTNPAVLQITGEMSVLEALVRTGGINSNARTDNLLLIRGGLESPELYMIDVDRLLAGELSQNAKLQRMDIIVVPSKTIVNVERFFRHVQGILSPVVSMTQGYRNMALTNSPVIEDSPGTE